MHARPRTSWEDASDGEIARAVLSGDVERYAVLVRRYQNRYARYAARMLGSREAAEDAVQDAFIRAYEKLRQCRDPDRFAGWFFLILRNRCFAERRRNHRLVVQLDVARDDVAAPPDADQDLNSGERSAALRRALDELTPEQREVVTLKHVEGLSYQEIAHRLGASVPSLKMRMHRAYDRLRQILRDPT